MLRCEALLGWCKNTPRPASVPHEVSMSFQGGGRGTLAVPFLLFPTPPPVFSLRVGIVGRSGWTGATRTLVEGFSVLLIFTITGRCTPPPLRGR